MTPLDGQEREALTAAWEEMRPRTPEEFLTPKLYFYAGVSAALAVREEPSNTLSDVHVVSDNALLDLLVNAGDEWWIRRIGYRFTDDQKRRFAGSLAALAAREDTERPDERETAWAAWLASWEAEPGDEDAFVAWWESYSRASQASRQLPLAAREEAPPSVERWMVDYENGEGEPQHAVLSWLDDEAKDLPEVGTSLIRELDAAPSYDAKQAVLRQQGLQRILLEVQRERDELRLRAARVVVAREENEGRDRQVMGAGSVSHGQSGDLNIAPGHAAAATQPASPHSSTRRRIS